ncbi:MAG: NAD(P)/FAD-dependent oxidoreductase [Gammaproteobacteria bacterium]|nr:NAD(P)/FAD-dependent oxidoreductase [Gammaproteobacteria bacterium]
MNKHNKVTPLNKDFPIVIIGSGFAGIGMGIQLIKSGIKSFIIIEREAEIGGTWRDNTYPGCACDVPSYVYSFSFEPNPNWSRMFSGGNEIQNYLLACVEKYGLREHMQFNTSVVEANYQDEKGIWHVSTSDNKVLKARAVVSAVGGLTDPGLPDFEGLEDYKGEIFHTARWNHDYDLKGKKVAVIGTGCSAVQVIPNIASDVEQLTVFQRTPAWVLPKFDRVISDRSKRLFSKIPAVQKIVRGVLLWGSEALAPFLILDSPKLSKVFERVSARHLRKSVSDPDLVKKLMPNFQFGCKRMIISSDYYPTLERDNVNLETSGISKFVKGGIVTKAGVEHSLDAVILATGFDLGLASSPFKITGANERSLDAEWESGAVAYKGVAISGYPNWFTIMGPNTGPGHTSVIIYTEAQINYIKQAIQLLINDDLKSVDVKPQIQVDYNEGIQNRMKHTVWTSGSCNSWYLNNDGSNHALYPGFAMEYTSRIRKFDALEYLLTPSDKVTDDKAKSLA